MIRIFHTFDRLIWEQSLELGRGSRLGFIWKWDHEQDDVTQVSLVFEPLTAGGTRLRLVHSGYTNDELGRRVRSEHVEGWMSFLSKLQKKP